MRPLADWLALVDWLARYVTKQVETVLTVEWNWGVDGDTLCFTVKCWGECIP